MARVRRICAGDGTSASNLDSVVRQPAIVKSKGTRVGDDFGRPKTGRIKFGSGKRPRDHRVRKNWHASSAKERTEARRRVGSGRNTYRARANGAPRSAQFVDTFLGDNLQ